MSTRTLAALDHLVVVAATLDEGVAWCQRTLGVAPGPGGEHPLMGTHNRLLSVASSRFPAAYLEVIAIQPSATKTLAENDRRWFDMDCPALQQSVQRDGPQLVHWVARVPNLGAAHTALAQLGLDPGQPMAVSRATPRGLLQWGITIRPDGHRPLGGCLPTLIQWGAQHPTDHMAPAGVQLLALSLAHPQAPLLGQALAAMGLALGPQGSLSTAPHASLQAVLNTPIGQVTLHSPEILNTIGIQRL